MQFRLFARAAAGLGSCGLLLLVGGCASNRRTPAAKQAPPSSVKATADAFLESRAALLMLEDRRLYEPFVLESMLEKGSREREALATAIGRIGDPRGRSLLQGLLIDDDASVRRAAAFGLGLLGDAGAAPALMRAAADVDAETGALAVEALGKLKAPLAGVRQALGSLPAAESAKRLLPSLFRFDEPGAVDAAREAAKLDAVEARRWAAYTMGRKPRKEGLDLLRGFVGEADPWIRAMAARGLGEVGELEDLPRLRTLAGAAEASPRIQALRAGAKVLSRAKALPPIEWGDTLRAALTDPRPGVRAAALEAAGRFLPNPDLEAALAAAFDRGEPREQELALEALATGHSGAAREKIERAASSDRAPLRAAAAQAAGEVEDAATLERLSRDGVASVRAAALDARLALAGDAAGELAMTVLADPDPAVRATALDALAASPVAPYERLLEAFNLARKDGLPDARMAAARAIAARGASERGERGAVLTALDKLADDPDPLVRREAVKGLTTLGETGKSVGAIETGHDLAYYRDVVAQTARAHFAEISTERGIVRVRLDCPQAPLTCLSFLKLAGQGFFDGIPFHRVVPDFVVQGGDPRGDGWGGPGYTLRDEMNRIRYTRGALGMALSGPDTGGSQFFLTLSPQPHLDGGYTVFGGVVAGDPVLDQIRQGDRIRTIREVEPPSN